MKRIFCLFLLPMLLLTACGASLPTTAEVDSAVLALAEERGWENYDTSIAPVDDAHWAVTVTFWMDTWAETNPSTTIGYSQAVLAYEKTATGWHFADPQLAVPDETADTVYSFTYDLNTLDSNDFEHFSGLQLALYLLHADGAYGEGPSDTLSHRALTNPDDYFATMAFLAESPLEHADSVSLSSAYNAFYWFTQEERGQYVTLLETYVPKNEAEAALLAALSDTYQSICDREQTAVNRQFSLKIGEQSLMLGPQEGAFPWGYDLTGELLDTGPADTYGTGYDLDCGDLMLSYFEHDGQQFLYKMSTTSPAVATTAGIACGSSETQVRSAYPTAVAVRALDGTHSAWVYEPGGMAYCKHIAFYMKDGVVAKIELEDLLDGRLLPE